MAAPYMLMISVAPYTDNGHSVLNSINSQISANKNATTTKEKYFVFNKLLLILLHVCLIVAKMKIIVTNIVV